jgi:hypothetical protein
LLAATFDLLNCSARAPAKQKNFRFLELTSSAFMVVAHSFNVPGDLRPLFGNDPRRLCVPPLKRFMEAGDGQVEQIEQIELLSWIERIRARPGIERFVKLSEGREPPPCRYLPPLARAHNARARKAVNLALAHALAKRTAIRAPPNGWNSRFRATDAYLIGLQAHASNESERGVDFGFKVTLTPNRKSSCFKRERRPEQA